MAKWRDKTKSYKDDTIESSRLQLGGVRLYVHRHISYEPDVQLASCNILFSQKKLKSKDLDEAKKEVVAIISEFVGKIFCDIESLQYID